MNKLSTLGIAALAATIATTASAAPYRPFRPHHNPPPVHRHGGWNAAPYIAGTIFTLGAIAAINANRAPVYAAPVGPDPHVDWCYRSYPHSYDVTSNTFIGHDGRRYYCDSPYN